VISLKAAIPYYASLVVKVKRVMTDNGSSQIFCFPQSLQAPRLKHIRTKPYTPKNQRQGRALHPDQPARASLFQCQQHFK
jgi:hypothetical protein